MPRKLLEPAPRWKDPEPTSWTLNLRTITPMFGGSATARQTGDPPIRAASIRGQLRFWWRATVGAAFTSASDLYKAERELWGDTDHPGTVQIRVEDIDGGKDWKPSRLPKADSDNGPQASYFLFPFQENKKENTEEATGRIDVSFRLVLSIDGLAEGGRDEIQRSIRAWLAFGGVGSRTRRGCGALACAERSWSPQSLGDPEYFGDTLRSPDRPAEFSKLTGGWILFGEPSDAKACWDHLGWFWSRFHKGHFTVNQPSYRPIRPSEWHDHATLTNAHGDTIALCKPYLGLPINYQDFPRDPKFRGKFSGIIEYGATGRMASAIVLKPLVLADGSIRPIVARLAAPLPNVVKIGGKKEYRLAVASGDPVLNGLGVRTPLEAVREAALKCGFKDFREVTL